ncbi:MAG: hypothetical protein AAF495_22650 [Pseudomonadota bacterium]
MNTTAGRPQPSTAENAARSIVRGMLGQGYYNRNSASQLAAIDPVLPWLEQAIAEMPLADPLPAVAIADFGCSEGANSVAALKGPVAALRARSQRPIQTLHSDLPTNDYAALFTSLRPEGRSVFEDRQTFSAVVGGSMYDQLLPARSLHIATSFNAIGYLSRRPLARLPNYVIGNGPSLPDSPGRVSRPERAVFAAQARDDLVAFLSARATELLPGGLLLVQCWGSDGVRFGCDRTHEALNDALLAAVRVGIIERPDYEGYYQPVYCRTLAETTAPVTGPAAPLARLYRLERAETFDVPVPFIEAYRQSGNAATYARDYTSFFRAFTEPMLRSAFAEHRQLKRLIAHVFTHLEQTFRRAPERYTFHHISNAVLLSRRAED